MSIGLYTYISTPPPSLNSNSKTHNFHFSPPLFRPLFSKKQQHIWEVLMEFSSCHATGSQSSRLSVKIGTLISGNHSSPYILHIYIVCANASSAFLNIEYTVMKLVVPVLGMCS